LIRQSCCLRNSKHQRRRSPCRSGAEASGRTITVLQLQNSRADRAFLLTTGEDTRADVNAFSLAATKRMSSNWQLSGSLTLQKATSANILGETAQLNFREYGRDPNNYINSEGRAFRDRPVMAKAQFLRRALPWNIAVGVDWSYYSGYPTRRQVRVEATNLNSTIQTEPRTDDKRFSSVNMLNIRLEKEIRFGKDARLTVLANLFNAFNDDAVTVYRSDLSTSDIYHAPDEVLPPRRLMLGAKLDF
jgi:hypothetical protein